MNDPSPARAASDAVPAKRVLGLILPPLARPVPEEGLVMYGEQVTFVVAGLGIEAMTPENFDAALARIPAAGRQLVEAGAEAIELMGTSLTFYRGAAFNQQLRQTVSDVTGLSATTMSDGVVEALHAAGAGRVAVATAYNDEVNARLGAFLIEHDFEPAVITGLGLEAMGDVDKVTQGDLLEFAVQVAAMAPDADALLVSCGGFRTLEIIAPLELRTGIPVVSSMPHGLWAGVRLLGLSGRLSDYGTVLAANQ